MNSTTCGRVTLLTVLSALSRNPVAYALGFLSCDDISARCMLSIFQFFATKTDASALRMLNGSPAERLLKPITDYIESK
jgi:zeta-carotene desaturase